MNSHPERPQELLAQAQQWWTRLHSGQATQADAQAFLNWRDQSPRHRQAWQEFTRSMKNSAPALEEALRRYPQWADLSVLAEQRARHTRRAFLGGALAVSAAGFLAWRPPLGLWPAITEFAADFRTGVGEQREIRLSHGIAVQMNTQTRINRSYGPETQQMELLAGEAEVEIASDADSALVVLAGPARIQARTGQFNVRYIGPQVTVTCLRGHIQVQAVQSVNLISGQQMVCDAQQLYAVQQADLQQVSSWRQGYLAFVDTPLALVIDEINLYRPGKILLRGQELGERPVRLRLAIRDMDLALDMLRALPGVQVQEMVGGIAFLKQA